MRDPLDTPQPAPTPTAGTLDAVAGQFPAAGRFQGVREPAGTWLCAFSFPVGGSAATLELRGEGDRSDLLAIRCPRATGEARVIAVWGGWQARLELGPGETWWSPIEVVFAAEARDPSCRVGRVPRTRTASLVEDAFLPCRPRRARTDAPADAALDAAWIARMEAQTDLADAVALALEGRARGLDSARFRQAQIDLVERCADASAFVPVPGLSTLLLSLSA